MRVPLISMVSPSMTVACSARSASADFEGETTENRLARRKRNWTPEGLEETDSDPDPVSLRYTDES